MFELKREEVDRGLEGISQHGASEFLLLAKY
jgi:hypothetical protein